MMRTAIGGDRDKSTYIRTSDLQEVIEAVQNNLDNLRVFTIQQTEKVNIR